MATKNVVIRAIDIIPDLVNKPDGAPIGWVQSLITKMQARLPREEFESALVTGLGDLKFKTVHVLTQVEEQEEKLAALRAKLAAVKEAIPATGPLTDQQLAAIRAAVG